MADLFSAQPSSPPAAHAAAPARKRPRLHTDTDIYEAVEKLGAHLLSTIANMRRDIKGQLGPELLFEASCMSELLREANMAVGAAKLPILDQLLGRLARLDYMLRIANRAGFLFNNAYANAIPILESIGRQASGLKNHFNAPAPAPAT